MGRSKLGKTKGGLRGCSWPWLGSLPYLPASQPQSGSSDVSRGLRPGPPLFLERTLKLAVAKGTNRSRGLGA
jgi:hypothetical protein